MVCLPDSTPPAIPESAGSSPNKSMIFLVALTEDAGFFPSSVCLWEAAHFVCSFFAVLTIPPHLPFIPATLRRHTPSEFTLAAFVLFLFVKGSLKYLLLPLLGKNQLAITLHMYASTGPNLENTHRGQI